MDKRLQTIMIANGAGIFLVGLAVGFPFAFTILEKIALWPIPGSIDWKPPGDVRGWKMAHLEGILNGLTLIAVASVGDRLTLSARAQAIVAWGLIITAWGNITASIIGPTFGGRGLEFGGSVSNSIVYLLFVLAIGTVVVAMIFVLRGALASLAASDGEE